MSFSIKVPPSGGSGGVSSLNGLSGALTLVAGSGITITPNSPTPGDITIAATSSGGITSINTDTTAAQTLTTGTTGTDFAIVNNGTGDHKFNLPTASAVNRGALSSADWSIFNSKLASTDGAYLLVNTSDATKHQKWDLSGQTTATTVTIAPVTSSDMILNIPQVATAGGAGMALVQDETTGFIFSYGISSSIGGANSMMQLANASTANRAQIKLHSYFNGASVAGVSTLTSRSGTIGTNAAIVAGQDYSKWTAQAAATTPGSAPISGAFAFKAAAVNSLTVTSDFHLQLTNTAGVLADRLYLTGDGVLQIPALNVAGGYVRTDASGNLSSAVVPNADATHTGFLTSTDWNTFNNKFDLPSLTDGSVLFSNGTTIAQDNTNFNWDDTGKTLALGGVFGPPGTVPYAQTSQRTATNPSGIDGAIFGLHYSNNSITNGSLNAGGYLEARVQVDAGVSVAANAGVIFQAYRNNGASDAGSLAYLIGAFGGAHQIGTDPGATTDLLAGVLSQVDISQGIANRVADFYGLAGSNGGTITTGQFGVYIEPPGSGMKDNWLSGQALIGGSSYASHSETLKVAGDMSATKAVTDSGVSAGIFNASSDTTASGSNTTIGINGVASATVQSGAENDKTLAGMNFAITRGDTTDQGILDTMNGANVLMFINSDTAGVTQKAYGFSNTTFSSKGTLTDLYDFYSERVPSGTGVITNHYGVYVKDDSTTPVKNWLSGRTQMGGSSFSLDPFAILDLQSTTGALLVPRMSSAQKTALTPQEGMIVYDTDDVAIEGYMGGTWTSLGGGGGGGANQHLSNLLSPTAVNQDLSPDAGATRNLGTVTEFWNLCYLNQLFDSQGSGSISVDVNNRLLIHSVSGNTIIDWDTQFINDNNNTRAINWSTRTLTDAGGIFQSLDWANRELDDSGANTALQWQQRKLYANDGATVNMDWHLPGQVAEIASRVDPVTVITGSTYTANAQGDYHIVLNNTTPGVSTLTLPAGVEGLHFIIGFASTNAGTWTAVGTGGDTVDANVTGNMASAVTVPVVFSGGVWYDA